VVGVDRGGEGFDGRRWLFLPLALFYSLLGTSLDDSQVHSGQNDPRFKGLVLENNGKVMSPDSGQNSPEQKKKRDTIARHDVVWAGKEKAADVLRRPDSLLHISR
jgi:hypothetical protein